MENFESIYRLYFADVYQYFLKFTGKPDLAEEITAETFFRALKAWEKFRGESSIKTYLIQIGKNAYFDSLRKTKNLVEIENFDEIDWPSEADVEEDFYKQQDQKALYQALSKLAELDRAIIEFRSFEEMTFKEIGHIYGKTANWACVRFHRAMGKLRNILEENQHG